VSAQVTTRRLLQNWHPRLAQRTRVLVIVLVLVCFGSSCGGHNPSVSEPVPDIVSSQPKADNPNVPEPPATSAPSTPTTTPSGVVVVPQDKVANVFAEPSLSSKVLGSLPRGTAVQILCTARGDTVANDSGAESSLWDKTQFGYLPDVVIDTGTDQPVADNC
jgi:hypothetical protein